MVSKDKMVRKVPGLILSRRSTPIHQLLETNFLEERKRPSRRDF
jgi:hypothetical protein